MGCGCVRGRDLTHVGASLSFPGVVQIRGSLWHFFLSSHGFPQGGLLDSIVVWVVIWLTLISQLTPCVTLRIPAGLWERLLQSSKRQEDRLQPGGPKEGRRGSAAGWEDGISRAYCETRLNEQN